MKATTVSAEVLSSTWNTATAGFAGLTAYAMQRYKVGVETRRPASNLIPNDRIMWQLGTGKLLNPLLLLNQQVNLVKGNLFNFAKDDNGLFLGRLADAVANSKDFDTYLEDALKASGAGIDKCFLPIRNVRNLHILSTTGR